MQFFPTSIHEQEKLHNSGVFPAAHALDEVALRVTESDVTTSAKSIGTGLEYLSQQVNLDRNVTFLPSCSRETRRITHFQFVKEDWRQARSSVITRVPRVAPWQWFEICLPNLGSSFPFHGYSWQIPSLFFHALFFWFFIFTFLNFSFYVAAEADQGRFPTEPLAKYRHHYLSLVCQDCLPLPSFDNRVNSSCQSFILSLYT